MWSFLLTHTPLFYLTQSIWRDEAFSILLAQRPLSSFITTITFEPPVYYILLHYWIKIFGTNEIVVRSLSLIGFALAVYVVILWAHTLFKKHWLSWFLPVFFFFNPELLYYAFEIRTYGWYTFFAVTSMFAYMEKKYVLYIIATTLGLYTHTYMIIVPMAQIFHHVLTRRPLRLNDKMLQSIFLVGILFSPWLIKVIHEIPRLKQSWYFPVDFQLIMSVLGNIFVGYEGTPWYLWPYTAALSLILLITSFRARHTYFFLQLFIPLIIIIGISFFKPIFVNRYVIPCTIAEIFLVVFAIKHIKHPPLQRLAATMALLFVLGFNVWYTGKYAKTDIRATLSQVNAIAGSQDVILTDSPLILFETMYYSDKPNVYWYNPSGSTFPWYVGDIVFSPHQIVRELPQYPSRAFIIHANGSFEIGYNL